jgi:hypothetical protein
MNLLITGFWLPTCAVPEENPLKITVNLNYVLKIICISIVKTNQLIMFMEIIIIIIVYCDNNMT